MTDDPNAVFAIESDPPDLAERQRRRFAEHMEREIAAAQKHADEDDELMAAAARGEPFWRTGGAAEVTGVAEYLPLTLTERLDQEHALFEQAQKDYAAFRLETAKLYLDHVRAAAVTGFVERPPGSPALTGKTMEEQVLLRWPSLRGIGRLFGPSSTLTERYAGATVDIPGGTIELGLQRNRGEPIALKRAEMKRIVAEEALALNGDDVTEDSAARLSDRIDARFSETWPNLAFWVEIWRAEERLTQVYHRWPWPGDTR